MALDITLTGAKTVHDESDGLQNNTDTQIPTGDADDNDINLNLLPSAFYDRLVVVGANPSTALGAALSGYNGSNGGEDVFQIDPNGSTIDDLAFTQDAEGTPFPTYDPVDPAFLPTNGVDSGLDAVDGGDIYLFVDKVDNNIVYGIDEDGDIAFAIYLEAKEDDPATTDVNELNTAGKIWTVQYEAISHGEPTSDDEATLQLLDKLYVTASRDLDFDLTNAPSGQSLFIMFGDGDISDGDSEVGIIATGKNPLNQSANPGTAITAGDTVNTSHGGGNTTFGVNNQMIDEGEGIYFTFVTDPESNFTVPNLNQNEADIEANIQFADFLNAKAAEFQVVQLQGGKTAEIKVTAYNETTSAADASGASFVDQLNDDEPVNISSVTISGVRTQGNTSTEFDLTFDEPESGDGSVTMNGITVDFTGNSFVISGAAAGDRIGYELENGSDHNRVLIENVGDGKGRDSADFDIGGFRLVQLDTDTFEIGQNIYFEDDGPAIETVTDVAVDEDNIPIIGNADTAAGDDAGGASATGTLTIDFGTDGTATDDAGPPAINDVQVELGLVGTSDPDTGAVALTSGGVAVLTSWDAATNTLTGYLTGGEPAVAADQVFTLSVDLDNDQYTYSQIRAFDHPSTDADGANDGPEISYEDNLVLTFTATATDGDGDQAAATFTVNVDDDTPITTGNSSTGTVDEDGVLEGTADAGEGDGIAGGTGDYVDTNTDGDNDESTTSGSVTGLFQSGADEPLTYGIADNAVTTLNALGLESGGATVNYAVTTAAGVNTVTATTDSGANTVFTFSLNETTGAWSFDLEDQLDHATLDGEAGDDTENDLVVQLGAIIEATDYDGDSVVAAAAALEVTVDDDTPITTGNSSTGTVDEDGVLEGTADAGEGDGIAGGTGDYVDTDTDGDNDESTTSGSVTGLFQSGADEPLTYGIADNAVTTLNALGLESGGATVNYAVTTAAGVHTVTATTDSGANTVFTFSLNETTGAWSFDLEDQLDHATLDGEAGDDTENDLVVQLGAIIEATDYDGDSVVAAAAALEVTVDDDTPTLGFGNLVGTVTTTPQVGFWAGPSGADEPGTLDIAAADADSDPNNGIQFDIVNADGIDSTGTIDTFAFDETDGRWEGTLTADFDNDAGNGDETVGFSLTVNTDGTYDFALDAAIVPVVVLDTSEGQLAAGGPDPVQTLLIPDTGERNPPIPSDSEELVFFAVDADTAEAGDAFGPANIVPAIFEGETDFTEAELQAQSAMADSDGNGTPGSGDFSFIRDEIAMNVSTSGIGVNNNVFQGAALDTEVSTNPEDPNFVGNINPFGSGAFDESFVINPESLASEIKVYISKTAGGFLPPNENGDLQGSLGATDYLYFNVYDEEGHSIGPILVTSGMVTDEAEPGGTGENLWSFSVDIDDLDLAGDAIDAIQFTMGYGAIKIPRIEVVVRGDTPPNDIFLDFEATLTDADGDSATSAFEIDLYGNDVISDSQLFDYTLADAGDPNDDAFNVVVVPVVPETDSISYLVQGFDTGSDELYLLGATGEMTLNTGSDLGVGTDADDSEVLVDGVSVIVEDATLTPDDITTLPPEPEGVAESQTLVQSFDADADLLLLRDLENSENFATIDFHHGYGAFNGGRIDADFGPSDFVVVDAKDALEDLTSTDTLII